MCRSGTGRALSACVRLLLRSMSEGRVYVQAEPFNRKIYTSVRCPVVRARHCLNNLSISLPAFLSISYFLDTFLSIFFPPVFPDLLFSHRNFLFPQQVFLFISFPWTWLSRFCMWLEFEALNVSWSHSLAIFFWECPTPTEIPTKADQMIWSNGLRSFAHRKL